MFGAKEVEETWQVNIVIAINMNKGESYVCRRRSTMQEQAEWLPELIREDDIDRLKEENEKLSQMIEAET
ncbi:hypothetical protein SASPL_139507 [Salvia splendens]|uniref:Uncharacterized protein n=1 Tax=Salvia splendens TaxID=180675 RepID=A0A8X8ZB22_SALSN|nr:hypothetical protein SASPL_139507 [Salvia splendens]